MVVGLIVKGGGKEYNGNSEAYCDSNPIECYNTVDDCKDGLYDLFEYIHDINITSLNDSSFNGGDTIEISVTVVSNSAAYDGVYIAYSNNTNSAGMNWTVIYSNGFSAAETRIFKFNKTLDVRTGNHSIRAIVEYTQYNNITCGRDGSWPMYSDTDDITFYVAGDETSPTINFSNPTPANDSTITTISTVINVSHSDDKPGYILLNWNGTNQTARSWSGSYTNFTVYNLVSGNYTYYVWINDTAGNENITETRVLEVTSPYDFVIDSPIINGKYTQSNIYLNYTAKSNAAGEKTKWTVYSLNGGSNVTVMSRYNISFDISDSNLVLNESDENRNNVSQSFWVFEDMEISNLSVKLKKVGNGSSNASLKLVEDNFLTGNVLANGTINNQLVDNNSYTWIDVELNATINLNSGNKYWIVLNSSGTTTNHFVWEAQDDADYGVGNYSNNNSRELLFRVYDLFKFREGISLVLGSNNITVSANDTLGQVASSSTINFVYDNKGPQYTSIDIDQDPIQSGETQYISLDVTDEYLAVDTVLIELNGVNTTMSLDFAPTYIYEYVVSEVGTTTYVFYMNDTAGNWNYSTQGSFEVTDSDSPVINSYNFSPLDDDALDPFVNWTITANVTDSNNISGVILEYRNISDSSGINITMNSNGGNLFIANITPTIGVYIFRIYANDTAGNYNHTEYFNKTVDYDWTWIVTPTLFGSRGLILGETGGLVNITVNNTGDYNLSFFVSAGVVPSLDFNITSFNLSTDEIKVIGVNVTAPGVEAVYDVSIILNASNLSADPLLGHSNGTFVSYTSGPYMTTSIVEYDSSVTLGDRIRNIAARITNVGNETANNVSSQWTLPSLWTSAVDLNKSWSTISVGQVVWHNLSVEVGSSASTGDVQIVSYVNSSEDKEHSDSRTVTVSSGTTTTTTTSSGGGSGGSSGGGGGGSVTKFRRYDFSIEMEDEVHLVAGKKTNINIKVKNIGKDTILKNLELSTTGYFNLHKKITKSKINQLSYNQTGVFELELKAPGYFKSDIHRINISISAIGTLNNSNKSDEKFSKNDLLLLYIDSISSKEGLELIAKAEKSINKLEDTKYNVSGLNIILKKAKEAYQQNEYSLLTGYIDEINSLILKAEKSYKILKKYNVNKLDKTENAKILYLEGEKLFDAGLFDRSLFTLEKMETAYKLEKGSPGLFTGLGKLFVNYWYLFLLGMISITLLGLIFRSQYSVRYITKQIGNLDEHETQIINQIKRSQNNYYIKKIIGERLYRNQLQNYRTMISGIHIKRVKLSSKKIKTFKFRKNLSEINEESEKIVSLIQNLQQAFYKEKRIDRTAYEEALRLYTLQKAELNRQMKLFRGSMIQEVKKPKPKIMEKNQKTEIDIEVDLSKTPYDKPKTEIDIEVDLDQVNKKIVQKVKPIIKKIPVVKKSKKVEKKSTVVNKIKKQPKISKKKIIKKQEIKKIQEKQTKLHIVNEVEKHIAKEEQHKINEETEKLLQVPIEENKPEKILQSKLKDKETSRIVVLKSMYNFYLDCDENRRFSFVNGITLGNLNELLDYLEIMENNIYDNHVDDVKNDFASWIEGVFEYGDLGKEVRLCKNKKEVIELLTKAKNES